MGAEKDRARNFIEWEPFMRRRATDAVVIMSAFVPQSVSSSYDFDIKRSPHGCWIARDRAGLSGGTFFTRKAAVRFALYEVGGDSDRVHVHRNSVDRRSRGP